MYVKEVMRIYLLLIFLYPATRRLDLSEMQLPQLATTESLPDLSSMFVFYLLSSISYLFSS
jgi:hypothetical protein